MKKSSNEMSPMIRIVHMKNIFSKNFSSGNHKVLTFKGRKGFTLVEVIVALTIIMVGIVGAYGLVNQSLAMANNASARLTAAYLGKEGIEIVRNIRDGNYLKIYGDDGSHSYGWDDGLLGCTGGCGADYTMHALGPALAGQPLKFDDGKLFSYSSAKATSYKRIITVRELGASPNEYLEVSVKVEWTIHGARQSAVIRENLYNWWRM